MGGVGWEVGIRQCYLPFAPVAAPPHSIAKTRSIWLRVFVVLVLMMMLQSLMALRAVMAAGSPLGCTCHARLSRERGGGMLSLSDSDTSQSCVMRLLPSAGQSVLPRSP